MAWFSKISFSGRGLSKSKSAKAKKQPKRSEADMMATAERLKAERKEQVDAAGGSDVGTRVELARYMDAFGDADGARWYAEKVPFHDAMALYAKAKDAQIALLEKKLWASENSEAYPVSGNDIEPNRKGAKSGMAGKIRFAGQD